MMSARSRSSQANNLARNPLDEQTRRDIIAAELAGQIVVVRRLQLGNWRKAGFGEWREVYRTHQKKEEIDGTATKQ